MAVQRKKARKGQRTTPKAIETRERRLKALELKKQGFSYDEIAVQLGYADRSGPFAAVRELLASWESESVDEMRAVENARLDRLLKAHEPYAVGFVREDPETGEKTIVDANPQHAEVVLKTITQRRAINGLDAPIKVETKVSVTDDQLAARLAALADAAAKGEGDRAADASGEGSAPDPARVK